MGVADVGRDRDQRSGPRLPAEAVLHPQNGDPSVWTAVIGRDDLHRDRHDVVVPAWTCVTCAVQYPDTDKPPAHCAICDDERQYVGWHGQQWTTAADLARAHATELREEEPDLIGVGMEPTFGIGQRALLVRTPHGNVRGLDIFGRLVVHPGSHRAISHGTGRVHGAWGTGLRPEQVQHNCAALLELRCPVL